MSLFVSLPIDKLGRLTLQRQVDDIGADTQADA